MRKIFFSLVVISFLIGGLGVLAQESDLPAVSQVELPDPGLTPDSSFYFLKTWKESIRTFFTFGAENKARQYLHLAEVRLAEYQKMLEKGKTEIAERIFEKYEQQLDRALGKVDEARIKGKNVGNITEEIKEKRIKHAEALIKASEKMPNEAKQEIFEDRSQKWLDFISAVEEKYPGTISHPPEGKMNLPAKLILNCPVPKLPEDNTCPGEWLFQSGGNCPYFACSDDGKMPVMEPSLKPSDIQPGELPVQPPESKICIQVITSATSPDGTCKEFPTPCDVPSGWKKIDKCSVSAVTPNPIPIQKQTPIPTLTPTPTPSGVACCFHDGMCKLETEKECLAKGAKIYGSSCSPNPCPAPKPTIPTPNPVTDYIYKDCVKEGMKTYKCPSGNIINWKCSCQVSEPTDPKYKSGGYTTWSCTAEPEKSCPITSGAPLAVTLLYLKYYQPDKIEICWTVNKAIVSRYVEYGTTASYGFTKESGSSEEDKLRGCAYLPAYSDKSEEAIKPDTTYHFRIVAEDANGNKIVSEDYTFTTGL